jgi:hypothetical protein
MPGSRGAEPPEKHVTNKRRNPRTGTSEQSQSRSGAPTVTTRRVEFREEVTSEEAGVGLRAGEPPKTDSTSPECGSEATTRKVEFHEEANFRGEPVPEWVSGTRDAEDGFHEPGV